MPGGGDLALRLLIAMKDLKERAIRGGVAKICAQIANFLLRIGSLMVLARLLDPVDFGLVGMVTAVTGVLSYFREFGLSTASVQRATISDEQMSTLFWINVVVGVLLGIVSLAVAPFVATFYHEPRLFMVTVVLGAGFVFNAGGVQHSALLQRRLRFTTLAIIEILSLVTSTVVSVVMAIRGWGYWALVAWSVVLPFASTLFVWLFAGWIPGRPRTGTGMGSMMRFGGTVTLNSLVVYAAYNLDKILLGRFWGAEVTGIYGRAYQLINLPTENLNVAVGAVAFPILSRVQDDTRRLRSYFLKAYALILSVTIPVAIVCALFADDLIFVMLGAKWNDAVPVFRLLAPTILAFALINPTGWLLVSLGMVGRSLKLALVIAPLVTTGCLIGLPYGPEGVALGFSAAMILWVVPHLLWVFHGTVVSYRDVLTVIGRPLLSGVAGALAVTPFLLWVGGSLSPFARLLLGCTILFSVYAWMLLFVMAQKPLYLDLLRGLKTRSSEEILASA
jgi:O-antigen/teichoic acid export membrane protein